MRRNNPEFWTALWQLITRVQREKIAPPMALRNSIGVALPLAVGLATGNIQIGLAISTGALNASFTDSSEPYRVRGWRMLAASGLVGGAVTIGELCGHNHVLAVGVTTLWAFAAGLLVALSTTAADLGVVSLVTMIVYGGRSSNAATCRLCRTAGPGRRTLSDCSISHALAGPPLCP